MDASLYDFKRFVTFQLNFEEISHEIDGVYFLHLLLDRGFGPIILDLLSYEGLQRLYQPQKLCDLADLEGAM